MSLAVAILVGIVLVVAWVAIDAFRRRRRRRAWVVLASMIAVLGSLAVAAIGAAAYAFPRARVEGRAMEPTLRDQDRLLVNRLAYVTDAPRRGDIVMLRYPPDPSRAFVMRIIATGNDDVRIAAGKVYVNGAPSDDSFVPSGNRSHDNWGPQRLPADCYFVMGDRRNNSSDSRHWGFVPRQYIVGRVWYRYWPVDSARGL